MRLGMGSANLPRESKLLPEIFPTEADLLLGERKGECVHREWRYGTYSEWDWIHGKHRAVDGLVCLKCGWGFSPWDVYQAVNGKPRTEYGFYSLPGEEYDPIAIARGLPSNALTVFAHKYSEDFVKQSMIINWLAENGWSSRFRQHDEQTESERTYCTITKGVRKYESRRGYSTQHAALCDAIERLMAGNPELDCPYI
jgi:hypothetical protein